MSIWLVQALNMTKKWAFVCWKVTWKWVNLLLMLKALMRMCRNICRPQWDTTGRQTTRPWVSKMADRRYNVTSNFAGQYIKMRMRRVHLSMCTEGIKAFSKWTRRCSVYERKRYENEKWGCRSCWKRSKTAPFSIENGLVWTGPE